MTKKWYFPFEYRVWQSDPALSQCSLAARGFWLEILCAMYAQDVYKVSGSLERIARMTRCESAEVAKFSLELKDADVCDVTLGHGDVTIVSRRLKRLLTTKEQNTLRKRKQRGHGDVTIHSNSNSNSKEIKSKKEEENPSGFSARTEDESMDIFEQEQIQDGFPIDDLIASFPEIGFTPAQIGHILADVKDSPIDREAWAATLKLYRLNYDPMKRSYLPTRIGTLLSVFNDEKTKIERGKNGKTNGKRTDADVLAESADFYANYDQQPIA